MKQITQNYKTGKIKLEEVPPPLLKKGGALVKTSYSLISAGTERATIEISKKSMLGKARARPDLVKKVLATAKKTGFKKTYDIVMNRLNAPVPLGYSLAGEVEQVAEGTAGVTVGDKVACAGAGYANHAETVFVPQNLMAKIPAGVSEKEAAFATVGSIALHGIRQANVSLGDRVGVIGLGLVGQITVAILKAQGCRIVGVDLDEYPVLAAKKMGAHTALLRSDSLLQAKIGKETNGIGLDAVIITAGTSSNDPFELSSEILRDKGTLVVVGGIRMEIVKSVSSLFYAKEIDIKFSRSYGPGRYDPNYEERGLDYPIGYVRWTEKRNMECFLELLASKSLNLEQIITHTFPFDDALKAYELIEGKKDEPYLGVILEYRKETAAESLRIPGKPKVKSFEGKIGVGMIGAGNFAQANILPFLEKHPDVILTGICTSKGMTAKNIADKSGFAFAAGSTNEIVTDKDTDAVFIATRHDSHSRYVTDALNEHKHVFVEKPFCLNRSELKSIVEAYQSARETDEVSVLVGYNRRFAPLSTQLKGAFEGAVSPITVVYRVNAGHIPMDNWYQDPSQGGRFIGEGGHFIDFGQFLTDSRPVRVNTFGLPCPDKASQMNDNLVVTVLMENGSVLSVVYNASGDSAMPKERVEVFGLNRSAILDDFKSLTIFKEGKVKKIKSFSQDKGNKNEIDHFIESLKHGEKSPISFDDLVLNSLTTFAAIESFEKKSQIEIGTI